MNSDLTALIRWQLLGHLPKILAVKGNPIVMKSFAENSLQQLHFDKVERPLLRKFMGWTLRVQNRNSELRLHMESVRGNHNSVVFFTTKMYWNTSQLMRTTVASLPINYFITLTVVKSEKKFK